MNVKFYRLTSLPTFASATHKGIFVHLTTNYTVPNSDPAVTYKAGLYFGGEGAWEYLTNDAAAITDAINGLDATTVATVTSANATSGTGTTFTFKGVQEENGVIAQGEGTDTFTVGDGALKLSGYGAIDTTDSQNPSIANVAATKVFGANDTADSTIALSNAFVLDATNKTIGLRTNTAVSAANNIATMSDIASFVGTAMHYLGAADNATELETLQGQATAAGDVIVIGTAFGIYQAGDTLVYNGSTWDTVQGNIDLGVAQGQVATNTAALTSGNIVVATGTGIQTSGYTPTDIASEAVSVSTASGVTTVSDTLTVGGAAQNAQSFTLTGSGVTLSSTNNAITITHDSHSATTDISSGTIDFTGDTATFDTNEYTFTTEGHIDTVTTKTWTITLPSSIATAVQDVDSRDIAINNGTSGLSQIVVVRDESDDQVHLTSVVKTVGVADATSQNDGLATAYDVQQYVEGFATEVTGSNSVSVTTTADSDPGTSYNVDLVWLETI